MLLKVKKVDHGVETEDKTVYKIEMEGGSEFVDVKLTIKSELKSEIENIVPMQYGEQRNIDLSLVNRTLDEYHKGD
ncbi:hypothetical protein [Methanococcoides sp. AM1]|uniref:hypothetical protein n=1 Tax=Methanococcoides sp. AM1 TaxID=1201011 RepID=UPI00108368A6|nr:hypothetical protein [Methanococcoides sp. AM1]